MRREPTTTILTVVISGCFLVSCTGPTVSSILPSDTAASAPGTTLPLSADSWITHVDKQLMPFWRTNSAFGKSQDHPFPTWRCNDGAAYGDRGCDFKRIKQVNEEARTFDKTDGPLEWLSGPNNELFKRQYIRMHSRQTYAYGVAYHLTGNPEYLKLAHRGVQWLLTNAIDKRNWSLYTYIENGTPKPRYEFRTSQDQSDALLGLAFYYYLTRDPKVFAALTRIRNHILNTYEFPKEDIRNRGLMRWMLENNIDKRRKPPFCLSTIADDDEGALAQKELVSLLDQLSAYMLLTTQTAPQENRIDWLDKTYEIAKTIRDRFYNEAEIGRPQRETGICPSVPPGMFAGCLTYNGPPKIEDSACPIDPENCNPSRRHTDFGYSITSLWMLDLTGREKEGQEMVEFSESNAINLLNQAFIGKEGSWARGYELGECGQPFDRVHHDLDTDKEWWIYAKLDQMSATLALAGVEGATMVNRLRNTYKYWLEHLLSRDDYGEVVPWYYDQTKPHDLANYLIPKANLWKNGFNSTEHGLVAYITTSGINHTPARLYYALVTEEVPVLRPYYYWADSVVPVSEGLIKSGDVTYQKIRAEFSGIRLRDPAKDRD